MKEAIREYIKDNINWLIPAAICLASFECVMLILLFTFMNIWFFFGIQFVLVFIFSLIYLIEEA